MKNVAIAYGGNFAGKLVDEQLVPMAPTEYEMPITLGLAFGWPILSKLFKLDKKRGFQDVDEVLTVIGAYESTKLWGYLEQMMAPPAVRVVRTVAPTPTRTTPLAALTTPRAISKYVVT